MELHASKKARVRLALDDFHYSAAGTLLLPDFDASRLLAERLNRLPDPDRPGAPPVKAWQLHAMGLINEIFHYLIGLYRESRKPAATREALASLREAPGTGPVETALARYLETFPPPGAPEPQAADAFLAGEVPGLPGRELILQEELVLWLANLNPAFSPGLPLFDDAELEREAAYRPLMERLRRFFDALPPFGPEDQNLVDMLRAPALAHPDSLYGQLEFIWKRWGYLLERFRHLHRLLSVLDWIREEETRRGAAGGRVSAPVLEFADLRGEAEQFSPDRDWMPRLVLLAKNTYVWLEQLSRRHGRWIRRLDQVPDEELDRMRERGFSGLWLIGLWERSAASAEIKRLRGNYEAVASAYSLHEYAIAGDLGGESALESLKARAWQRGLRLASDMVPNHMGIDSRWVVDHPNWFLSRDQSPYPSYTFNGPDLSRDPRVGIFIEDHYYQETDAAVVFKRQDRWTGSERYLYHGNDGTSTPWNDTAQLNYLNAEVREAVIGEILGVARRFPVIRFDAAMTLAKRHYQRLWFPEPGTGGAIPSRAEFGLTRAQLDALMPREFWREVVDRVAREAPDTLLLAEAFWLMEGYFVRTLGMHRVYNSAFMNMLRDEENAKYRSVIKNTLEFDPEVLRRYVNFMNNPDEDPAVEAFGKGDKYFGICTLMATLPGLPMFGHGQWEGFLEKYGMEFRHPRLNEAVDEELAARHDREISPLLRRRELFAGVENFLLYDFFTPEGGVDENVYAFSNGLGDRRGLVLYQNRFASTRGWIRVSAAFARKREGGGSAGLVQRSLAEGLGLTPGEDRFTAYRELSTNLEHLLPSRELCERGLYSELHAYQCRVLLDVRELRDGRDRALARLCAELGGRGVPDLDQALREVRFRPIRLAFRELAGAEMLRRILEARPKKPGEAPDPELLGEIEKKAAVLLAAIREASEPGPDRGAGVPGGAKKAAPLEGTWPREIRDSLRTALDLASLETRLSPSATKEVRAAASELQADLRRAPHRLGFLIEWALARPLEEAAGEEIPGARRRSALAEWGLAAVLSEALRAAGRDETGASRDVAAIGVSLRLGRWWERESPEPELPRKRPEPAPGKRAPRRVAASLSAEEGARRLLDRLSADEEARRLLGFNVHQETLYLNQEALEELSRDLLAAAAVELMRAPGKKGASGKDFLRWAGCRASLRRLLLAAGEAGFKVETMRRALGDPPPRQLPPR